MPQRDGEPTAAERSAAAQQAGGGPPPSPILTPPDPGATDAAALALTVAAAGTAATPVVVSFAAAGIMGAFDRFLRDRRPAVEQDVMGLLETHAPALGREAHAGIVDTELEREKTFAGKARDRLNRDLPKALMIADPTLRQAQVNAVLERERRYARQREEAVAMRALGEGELEMVLRESPTGAYWKLSPHVSQHTADCLAMGGKAWPPSVLRRFHPPTHGGCECELVAIPRAISEGYMTLNDVQSADQVVQALSMQETPWDAGDVDDEQALLEAYTLRYSRGTEHGGEFRPRRGGDPGRLVGLRMHGPRMPHAMANAGGRRFEHREYPEGHGIHDTHADKPYAVFGKGDDAREQAQHSTNVLNEAEAAKRGEEPPEPPKPSLSIDRVSEGYARVAFPTGHTAGHVYREAHGSSRTGTHWVAYTPGRNRIGHGDTRDDAVRHVAEYHAAREKPPEPPEPPKPPEAPEPRKPPEAPHPTPQVGDRIGHAGVQELVGSKKPPAAGRLSPGFHFAPDLTRSETRGDDLHLAPGFWKLTREKRAGVIHRHLGRQLAERVGPEGRKRLAEQTAGDLGSSKAIAEHYTALNTPGLRERMAAMHPDALRLVAQAAHDHGFALHPDAEKHVGRPHPTEEPPAEHPAHALAKRLDGLSSSEAHDHLLNAGFMHGGSFNEGGGGPTLVYRNHDAGASIGVTFSQGAREIVQGADVTLDRPISAESSGLHGKNLADVRLELRRAGHGADTLVGGWHEFVHPNEGRGSIAVKTDGYGNVTHAAHFDATANERKRVAGENLAMDPLHNVKPGDDNDRISTQLTRGMRWRTDAVSSHVDMKDGGFTPPEGVLSSVDYTRSGAPDDRIRIQLRRGDGPGSLHVHAIGRPGEKPGELVSEAEYHAGIARKAEAEQRRLRERREQGAAQLEGLKTALEAGDAKAIEKAVLGLGRDINGTVVLLRDQFDMQLRDRRRSTKGGERRITYTLRGTNGETLKVVGEHSFRGSSVIEVKAQANPQGVGPEARRRLEPGQAPKTPQELYRDALGRADELAARHEGAKVNVTSIHVGGVQRNAIAHHEWNGAIAVLKRSEQEAKSYLKRRAAGEKLTDYDHLAFYQFVQVLAHEVNHGIGPAGDEPGGMAFGPKHYGGHGKTLEEALTEETAHHEAHDWLREMGMPEVLRAVKRNPNHGVVTGTYVDYRIQLKQALDAAGVPESDRIALMRRMKYQQGHGDRMDELARRLNTDRNGVGQALRANPKERSKARSGFEPITRPGLDDIRAYDAGHHVLPGDRILFYRGGALGSATTSHSGVVSEVHDNGLVSIEGDASKVDRTKITNLTRDGINLPNGERAHPGDRVQVPVAEPLPGSAVEQTGWGRLENTEGGTLLVVLDDGRTIHVDPAAVSGVRSPLTSDTVTTSEGRTITVGDEVTVTHSFDTPTPGVVHEIAGDTVKVASPDGLLLWHIIHRIH